jgi:hypothetical protein
MRKTSKFYIYYEFLLKRSVGAVNGEMLPHGRYGHTRCKIKKCPVCCVLLEISIFAAV